MNPQTAIAIAAHPDDIELKMAGTLLQLKRLGWEIHYFNIANGNGGSLQHDSASTATIREKEAREAAEILGATWHPPLTDDFGIFYEASLLKKVSAVVREVKPSIVLTHPLEDYMEDHTNAARLALSAAFSHGIPNIESDPPQPAFFHDVTVYHCMPHGGRTPMRQRVMPGAWVDTTDVHATAREALAAHRSQQQWLDSSQGMNDYLAAMDLHALEMGALSGNFTLAEGWRRHLHLGFSSTETDPLADVLGGHYLINEDYEAALERPQP